MTDYQNIIQAFINIIESQAGVILEQDWIDLNQFQLNLPETNTEIADQIEGWLEPSHRNYIRELFQQEFQEITELPDATGTAGPGGSKSTIKPGEPSSAARELLINTIQKNSPLFEPPSSDKKS
jgi:hypothetical protein